MSVTEEKETKILCEVKWEERMIKSMIAVYFSDKKERRLGSQKLDQLPITPEYTDVLV